jgi:hypothetical protein
MHELRRFFKANPQVLVLLLICLVLGIGTFLAVLFGVLTSKSTTSSGEPEGSAGPRIGMARPARIVMARPARILMTHRSPRGSSSALPIARS